MEQKVLEDKPSGMSIAALITGILGLAIVPIILAIIDMAQIRKGISSPQGMALDIAGLVLGALGVMAFIIIAISVTVILLGFFEGRLFFSNLTESIPCFLEYN